MPDDVTRSASLTRSRWTLGRFCIQHWTSLALIAALLAVLTLQSLRWPGGLRISGRLVASSVTIGLNGDLEALVDLSLLPPEASLRGTAWISPPVELAGERRAVSWAQISAAALRLSRLQLGHGGVLRLEHEPSGRFLAQAEGAGGTLVFGADGPVTLKLPDAVLRGGDGIEGLELSVGVEGTAPAPLVLRARTSGTMVLDDVPISLIRFGHRQGDRANFVSSVVSGSLKLVDVGNTETLEAGSALQIEEFRGEVTRLEQAENGYRVSFSGRAERVQLGPPGFAEDLTPSILEFLYHQDSIKMMWLSALAGLAAVVKVRSWLTGKVDD